MPRWSDLFSLSMYDSDSIIRNLSGSNRDGVIHFLSLQSLIYVNFRCYNKFIHDEIDLAGMV